MQLAEREYFPKDGEEFARMIDEDWERIPEDVELTPEEEREAIESIWPQERVILEPMPKKSYQEDPLGKMLKDYCQKGKK